jgi:hypothetical protein
MKQVVEIKAENVIGKKIKDVTLVFEDGKIIESWVRVEDGSYLKIDPLKDKELFVMEFPSEKFEWLTERANDQAHPQAGRDGALPREETAGLSESHDLAAAPPVRVQRLVRACSAFTFSDVVLTIFGLAMLYIALRNLR